MKKLKFVAALVLLFGCYFGARADVIFMMDGMSPGDTLNILECSDEGLEINAPSGYITYQWWEGAPPNSMLTQGSPMNFGGVNAEVTSPTTMRIYGSPIMAQPFTLICDDGAGTIDTFYLGITYENMEAVLGAASINAGPDKYVCGGSSVKLFAVSKTSGLNVKWNPGGIFTDTLNVSTGGWYEINGCRAGALLITAPNSCCTRDSIQAVFSTPPGITTNGDSTICFGDSVFVNTTVTDTAAGATLTWSGDVGNLSSTSIYNPSIKPATQGTSNYKLVVVENSPAGCKDSAEFQVTMVAPLDPGLLYTDTTVCASDTFDLVAAPTGGSGSGHVPQWFSLNPKTLVQSNNSYTINGTTVETQYIFEIIDDLNCSAVSDTVTVTPTDLSVKNTTLVDSINYPNGRDTLGICAGDGATMCIAGMGGTPPYSYSWFPTDSLSSLTDSCTTSRFTETIDYAGRVTDAGGCFVEDSFHLEVVSLPFVLLPANKLFLCVGDTFTVVAEASGGTGSGYTFDWNVGFSGFDTLIAGNVDSALFVKEDPNLNNDIRVSVTDGFGCASAVDVMTLQGVARPSATPDTVKTQTIIFADTLDNDAYDNPANYNNFWTAIAFNSGGAADYDSIFWILEDSATFSQQVVRSGIENIRDTTFEDVGGYTMILRLIAEQNACSVEYELPFRVIEKSSAYVYNVITPNGDDLNDQLYIENLDYFGVENTFIVINRWGSEVFRTNNYNNIDNYFDGGDLPDGTYYYYLDVTGDPKTPHKGTFMIIR